jgi:prepilin-type N-terminal cleavage/methylation domain-containing protein
MNQRITSGAQARIGAAGFTLIELLVTIGVAAILAAIALPAFNNFILNDRDAGQINALVGSFNYARSEAVKRNTSYGVQVCASSDGQTCNGLSTAWYSGWIVLDMNPADANPITNALLVLQYIPALGGTNTMSNGTVAASVKIKVCDMRGSAFARDVEVSPVGSITASQTAGKDASGNALTCP